MRPDIARGADPGPAAAAQPLRVAVVGAGWAGLAAAVDLVRAGHRVEVLEMAGQPGGRARTVETSIDGEPLRLDNGQHILIGAYVQTLDLMRRVGADPAALLLRQPLALVDAAGRGLRLPPGAAVPAFVRGVLGQRDWPWAERLALLAGAGSWALRGFRCPEAMTVAALTGAWPRRLLDELVEPLCVAALNTPAAEASARVFLRVLCDALFAGPGASDLLLPRVPLGELLPEPAVAWLRRHGSSWRCGQRVEHLAPDGGPGVGAAASGGWRLDGQRFDRVVLACGPRESARLLARIAPDWAASVQALRHEPIVTTYLQVPGLRLAEPMLRLPTRQVAGLPAPAQFAFDLAHLQGAPAGRIALVASGAQPWIDRGSQALDEAMLDQARALAGGVLPEGTRRLRTLAEKRATFRCTPDSIRQRPPATIAPGLLAAGDHVEGPYPATLEGAVRSGRHAARLATAMPAR